MAQTIATAYVQIMPSTRGLKAALEKDLEPSVKSAGATAGKAMGDAVATETSKVATPRLNRVFADAARDGKITFSEKVRGIGASLVDEFKATGGISQTVRTVGDSMDLTGAKSRGLVERFRAVTSASNGMSGGLSALSGVLMGPLGAALAAGGLALTAYMQAQENATKAGEKFLETLDKQTGATTVKTYQTAAQDLLKEFSSEELAKTPFTIEQVTGALVRGGKELEDLKAKIKQLQGGSGFAGSFDGTAERYNRLSNAVNSLSGDVERGGLSFKEQQKAIVAASLAANGAGDGFDNLRAALFGAEIAGGATAESLKAAADAAAAQGRAAREASAQQTIYQNALASVAEQADTVTDRIARIPADVRITAKAVGLDSIIAQADAAAGAYLRMAAAASAANVISVDGERHGADLATSEANRKASTIGGAASAAYRKALAELRAHNRAADKAASSAARGASRAASTKTDPLRSAKASLLASVSGTFAKDLAESDADGVAKFIARELELVRNALNGKAESSLVALLRKDNVSLRSLADQRAATAKALTDAESRLAEKRQTIDSVSRAGIGSLGIGSRSVSGVRRTLTKQVALIKSFRTNLGILAKRGLPEVFLRGLFNAGLDGAYTAAALAKANDVDFATVKSLTTSLSSESNALGQDAGRLLYDTGGQTIEGLIAGLRSKDKALEDEMVRVAKSMQRAIRKALGIKSPSTVFAQLGAYTGEGFRRGLEGESRAINRSVSRMVRIPQPTPAAPAPSMGSVTIPVYAAANVHETAHAVANEIVWRNQR